MTKLLPLNPLLLQFAGIFSDRMFKYQKRDEDNQSTSLQPVMLLSRDNHAVSISSRLRDFAITTSLDPITVRWNATMSKPNTASHALFPLSFYFSVFSPAYRPAREQAILASCLGGNVRVFSISRLPLVSFRLVSFLISSVFTTSK